ncbi:preprotein translocase subunit SecG [Mariprofundus sp. EBB-1]|uniref:preprotein translocase subunit SecG n=1 Tax=Mariprofundus sp. EBB-1 TaxID=2650971 RepID=UPI000EF1E10B|nr:preprotein translocase subunit SecG [Mariprofundus sp. EBB-1]RLL55059.1 preprotein translocase subunit SecG [Mariprofundus sp. EBB-1]
MTTVLIIVHVLVALTLIGVVLVQRGQGADMGASFGGGGAQTLFGSRGSGSFLGKLTGGLAATFMVTSLTLAFFSQQQTGSLVDRTVTNQVPVEQPANTEAPVGFNPALLKSDAPVTDGLPGAE